MMNIIIVAWTVIVICAFAWLIINFFYSSYKKVKDVDNNMTIPMVSEWGEQSQDNIRDKVRIRVNEMGSMYTCGLPHGPIENAPEAARAKSQPNIQGKVGERIRREGMPRQFLTRVIIHEEDSCGSFVDDAPAVNNIDMPKVRGRTSKGRRHN